MGRLTNTRLGVALFALLGVTACSNSNSDQSNLFKSIPKAIFTKKAPPPKVTPQMIAQAVGASDKPVTLFVSEKTETQFLMLDIQKNGPYHSFGSSSRQVIVQRDGMITSTRGLGGDLMSSEEGALLARVRSKANGSARYIQRYLSSDDQTLATSYECSVQVGAKVPVVTGLLNTSAHLVTADCQSETNSFTNTYAVDAKGQILSSRQWLGDTLGYLQTQVVRP